VDDRALVAALVSGDPRGLEGAYRVYADRIYTYCRGMLRDADAAADAVHDTFVLASMRADQLRDPDRLRPWLYAIARNECLRSLRGRARQVPLEEAGQVSAGDTDPGAGMRAAEIQQLVWAAAEGLNQGDREVFEVAVRHDLPAQEISGLLGVSVAHAHARLSRARTQLERAIGALLVARTGTEECPQLAELLRDWDGRLTALVRKRVGRHIESCETCGERQRQQLRPAALFSAYAALPFLVAPVELWPRLELTSYDPGSATAREAIARRAGRFRSDTGFPRPLDIRRRRFAVAGVGAVAVAALLAAGAGAMIPPAAPVADATDPQPTVAAVASPAAGPTSTPAPSATPTLSPSPASTAPGQPAPPPPAPPPPPPNTTSSPRDPPSDTASPSPPATPLEVRATGCMRTTSDQQFFLAVSATASHELASATLIVVARTEESSPMNVDGQTASLTQQLGGEPKTWWVTVAAVDGRTAQSPEQVVTPC
jgi:RNA polymerase sigma factor (sigma-70 family)